jgi:hypothetical protein
MRIQINYNCNNIQCLIARLRSSEWDRRLNMETLLLKPKQILRILIHLNLETYNNDALAHIYYKKRHRNNNK